MDFIGVIISTLGFIFGIFALTKIVQLEKHLKETGILDKNYKSHREKM